jgi:hypothetical protein
MRKLIDFFVDCFWIIINMTLYGQFTPSYVAESQ